MQGDDPKIYNRAEDPKYVVDHSLPIDVGYYIHQQMKKPFIRIFEQIIGEREALRLFEGSHVVPRNMPTMLDFVTRKPSGRPKREYRIMAPGEDKTRGKKIKRGPRPGDDTRGILSYLK